MLRYVAFAIVPSSFCYFYAFLGFVWSFWSMSKILMLIITYSYRSNHRNLWSLRNIPPTRVPKSPPPTSQIPRLQARRRLGHMGVSRRRNGISRLGGLWKGMALPMARSSPPSLQTRADDHGGHEKLAE